MKDYVKSMKMSLCLCYCLLVLPLFSQNRISVEELKRYEWIVYNTNVDDSSEIFISDTLFLAKSYEMESFDPIIGEDNQQINQQYDRCWRIDLTDNYLDTSGQVNEFSLFFIDIRQASMSKSIEVDSATYHLLHEDPNAVTSEMTPVALELEKMLIGDLIEMIDSLHNRSFYIEKTVNKLRVIKTLRRRFILYPIGINGGFWTFSKRNQLITFSDDTNGIKFLYRVERIDKIRIRLIHTATRIVD